MALAPDRPAIQRAGRRTVHPSVRSGWTFRGCRLRASNHHQLRSGLRIAHLPLGPLVAGRQRLEPAGPGKSPIQPPPAGRQRTSFWRRSGRHAGPGRCPPRRHRGLRLQHPRRQPGAGREVRRRGARSVAVAGGANRHQSYMSDLAKDLLPEPRRDHRAVNGCQKQHAPTDLGLSRHARPEPGERRSRLVPARALGAIERIPIVG